jgi:hypothetical protein
VELVLLLFSESHVGRHVGIPAALAAAVAVAVTGMAAWPMICHVGARWREGTAALLLQHCCHPSGLQVHVAVPTVKATLLLLLLLLQLHSSLGAEAS